MSVVIRQVQQATCTIRVDGGILRVTSPTLPDGTGGTTISVALDRLSFESRSLYDVFEPDDLPSGVESTITLTYGQMAQLKAIADGPAAVAKPQPVVQPPVQPTIPPVDVPLSQEPAPEHMACPSCGDRCRIFTSRSDRNPGRQYIKCNRRTYRGRDYGCGQFTWVDEVDAAPAQSEPPQPASVPVAPVAYKPSEERAAQADLLAAAMAAMPPTASVPSTPPASLSGQSQATHDAALAKVVAGRESMAAREAKGLDGAEVRLNAMELVSTSDEDLYELNYDIPDATGLPNPSNRCTYRVPGQPADTPERRVRTWTWPGMWHFGFRYSDSNWVLPQKSLEAASMKRLLALYQEAGVIVNLVPYHPRAISQMREIARQRLIAEVRRLHESLVTRMIAAKARWDEAVKKMDEEAASRTQRHAAQVKDDANRRSILKDVAERLNGVVACCEAFEASESTADLLAGLRQVLREEVRLFNLNVAPRGGTTVRL